MRKKQDLERTIEKKYSTCEQELRDTMRVLSELMKDDDGEDVLDLEEDLKARVDHLLLADHCYAALAEYHRESAPAGTTQLLSTRPLSASSSSSSSSAISQGQGAHGAHTNPEDVILECLRRLGHEFGETAMAFYSAGVWKDKLLKKSKKRSKGRSGGPKCPCCDRAMNDAELNVFEQNLTDIFEKTDNAALEQRAKQKDAEAQDLIKQFTVSCQQAKGLITCRQELEAVNHRIQEFQEQLERQLQQKEQQGKKTLESTEEAIRVTDKCIFELGSLLNTWTNISTRFDDLRNKKRRHTTVLSSGGHGENRSMRELELEQRQFQEEKEHLQKMKERLLEEENSLSRQQHILKDNLSSKELLMSELAKKEHAVKEFELKLTQYQEAEQKCEEQLRQKSLSKGGFERNTKVQEEQERAAR